MTEAPEIEVTALPRNPGEILKQAREDKGLSIAAIATQLNLDMRTVEALEKGDLSKLPAPIFVRGYLRGYARLVSVREEEVLAAYQTQAPQEPAPRAVSMAHRSAQPAFLIPAIPWRGLIGVLVLAGLVMLAVALGPQLMNRLNMDEAQEATPMNGLALPVPADAEPVAQQDTVPIISDSSSDMMLTLPEPTVSIADDLQSPAVEMIEPSMPSDHDFGTQTGTNAETTSPATTLPSETAPKLAPGQVEMNFNFSADSWVEVLAADRSKLLFGLLRKGESRSVTGQAPVSVLLGNAAAATLTVNGAAFDYAKYTSGNIARFKVPAQP